MKEPRILVLLCPDFNLPGKRFPMNASGYCGIRRGIPFNHVKTQHLHLKKCLQIKDINGIADNKFVITVAKIII